jgi:hypothetical protein
MAISSQLAANGHHVLWIVVKGKRMRGTRNRAAKSEHPLD